LKKVRYEKRQREGIFSLIPYLLNQALDIRHYLKLIVLRIHDILGWIRIHASAILGIKVFLQFLHDDRRIQSRIRIRIRIHTSDKWIRIREAQKHVDPDPQHFIIIKID
jgi:hypothetical protein